MAKKTVQELIIQYQELLGKQPPTGARSSFLQMEIEKVLKSKNPTNGPQEEARQSEKQADAKEETKAAKEEVKASPPVVDQDIDGVDTFDLNGEKHPIKVGRRFNVIHKGNVVDFSENSVKAILKDPKTFEAKGFEVPAITLAYIKNNQKKTVKPADNA